VDEPVARSWKRTSVELPTTMIEQLEQLRREWGLRHRGAVLERVLQHIFEPDGDEPALPEDLESASRGVPAEDELDDQVVIVVRAVGLIQFVPDNIEESPVGRRPEKGAGVDVLIGHIPRGKQSAFPGLGAIEGVADRLIGEPDETARLGTGRWRLGRDGTICGEPGRRRWRRDR